MKHITDAYRALLLTQNQFSMAELYTFTLRDGTKAYYTDLDVDILLSGVIFRANSIRIENLKYKLEIGWSVDEQEVVISAFPDDLLAAANFFTALQEGLLDGAYLTRERAFWVAHRLGGAAQRDLSQSPIDRHILFTGRVSTIEKVGRTSATFKVKSPMSLLDIDMPRNTYQPACQWMLYDAGCTVDRASHTATYTVVSADHKAIVVSAISPETGGDGQPNYKQGRLLFTSGVNSGIQTMISNNSAIAFDLQYPLLVPPSPGDTFKASAGCAKTGRGGACELKFANLHNFRGFSRVPPVVMSI